MEYGCYCQWFDYVTKQNPPHLDLIGRCTKQDIATVLLNICLLGKEVMNRRKRRFCCECSCLYYHLCPCPTHLEVKLQQSFISCFSVYLRSSPEVCFQRLQQRGRKEEKPVTLVCVCARFTHACSWKGSRHLYTHPLAAGLPEIPT